MFGTVLRQYGESLRNSVFVGVFTAVLSTILSLSAALVCATARGWKKTLCMIIMLVAMVSPPFVSSLAYIQLYGRRGWITYRLLHLSLNPYNRWGVILMQSISFVPLNAMFLSGILEKLDEGSLRSARDLGASGGAILRDIVLPLIRPATLVCLLLSFVRSLADFGTPIIIGGRFSTLAADIYLQVVGYSDLEKSSAMNMFLLVPSIVFFFVYRALMRRSDRLTEGSRASQGSLGLTLPHCGAMGWGMITLSTVFFVMIVLQYGCVFLSGFLKSTKGVYSFTLQYWDQLWRIGSSTMLRSVEYRVLPHRRHRLPVPDVSFFAPAQGHHGKDDRAGQHQAAPGQPNRRSGASQLELTGGRYDERSHHQNRTARKVLRRPARAQGH